MTLICWPRQCLEEAIELLAGARDPGSDELAAGSDELAPGSDELSPRSDKLAPEDCH